MTTRAGFMRTAQVAQFLTTMVESYMDHGKPYVAGPLQTAASIAWGAAKQPELRLELKDAAEAGLTALDDIAGAGRARACLLIAIRHVDSFEDGPGVLTHYDTD